jgi:hypothetical protein
VYGFDRGAALPVREPVELARRLLFPAVGGNPRREGKWTRILWPALRVRLATAWAVIRGGYGLFVSSIPGQHRLARKSWRI